MMMNAKRVQSYSDSLTQGKMARLEGTVGTVVPPGLPKTDDLPQYSQEKSLPYRRAYMSCSVSEQERLDLPSSWSPSRTYVINGGSPVVHSSATEGSITSPVFYRPENAVFPVDSHSPAATEELVAKHKLAYYNRSKHSPNTAGLISPVALRKLPVGCTSLSPSTAESSVGLAIPKPVYSHSPCCSDRKCTVGQHYAERGPQRVHPQMFEDEWAAHYSHWMYLHKKEQETLMQQRILPFEHSEDRVPLKDVTTQDYHGLSSSRPRRGSAFSEPSNSSYSFSPAHPFVPASPVHCQRFQMRPQVHKNLPPMYDPLTRMHYGTHTQMNQDHPPISKYGEVQQHSLLYCPQNNTKVYRPENPHHIVEKQASGPCPVPQPYYSDLPNPYSMLAINHPAVRNVPAYSSYRMHLNNNQVNQFTERPCPPTVMHQVDRPLDFSMRREHNSDSHQEPHGQFGISGTFHRTQVQNHLDAQNSTVGSSDKSQDNFSVSSMHNYRASPQCISGVSNKKDLCVSDNSGNSAFISKRHREDSNISCEMGSFGKVQKMNQLKADETQMPSSPPMPVIKKVFSLAPYKAYLESAGMFSPTREPVIPKTDLDSPKEEPETQNTYPETLVQGHLTPRAVQTPPVSSQNSDDLQTPKIKQEKAEPVEITCESETNEDTKPVIRQNNDDEKVKEEPADSEPAVCYPEHNIVIVKSDFESECKPVTPEIPEPTIEWKTEPNSVDKVETILTQIDTIKPSYLPATLPPNTPTPPQTPQAIFSLTKIPPQCLKLSSHNIIVPDVLKAPVPPSPEVPKSPVEIRPAVSKSRQARYQFMELHQSLCRLISASVSETSHKELRQWLSSLDLVSPPAKTQKVSCLLGTKARVWLKGEETVKALQRVLCILESYVVTQECPFLHVMRAGAVFIPMLVVKEVLFPQVQGTFIDQVLQDHRVELRPTTLSEERHLTQLHRQAFSSKLRRLLSLKHLPDIYSDVLNLLYYVSVCKFLGLEVDSIIKRECAECSDEAEGSGSDHEVHGTSLRPQTPDAVTYLKSLEETSCTTKCKKSKGRVKSACKRMFLGDESSSPEDDSAEETTSWCFENSLEEEEEEQEEEWENVPVACSEKAEHVEVKIEEDAEQEPENSWRCPLTSDDLSTESSEAETELPFWSSGQSLSTSSFSKSHSGMVLKLRKVYYTNGHQGRVSHYQRVLDNPDAQDMGSGDDRHRQHHRKKELGASKLKKQHTLSSSSHRPKYCPSSSSQRVSKHRRRWVLRSATQQTMMRKYPDLVGKRIRHLYEENDKTEVWYRGVVLRIHEPHPNPLKTVFEVKYDSEPEWQYYLELLVDYKKGWLKIED